MFPNWSLVMLSLSANWHFRLLLLSHAISQGCSGLGFAWPVQLSTPSHVSCLPSSQTGHLSTVHVNVTSQICHWQVGERICGFSPGFMLLVVLSFLCSGIHCIWRQWCFMLIQKVFKNTKSVLYKFLHWTASKNYLNIPLTCHLSYIPCSLVHLNAFVKVLNLRLFFRLSSILLFTYFLWLYFLSDV